MEQERFHRSEQINQSEPEPTNQEKKFSSDFDITNGGYNTNPDHLLFGEPLGDGSSIEQTTGEKWYIHPIFSDDNKEKARELLVAQRLFHYLGIPVPETQLCKHRGKLAIATKAIEIQRGISSSQMSAQEETRNGFLIDVLINGGYTPYDTKLNSINVVYRILHLEDTFFWSDRNIPARLARFAENPIYKKVTEKDQIKMAKRITRLLTDKALIKLSFTLSPRDEWQRSAFIACLIRNIEEIREHFGLSKIEEPIQYEEWKKLLSLLPKEQLDLIQEDPRGFQKICEKMGENRFSHVLSKNEAKSSLRDSSLVSAEELSRKKSLETRLSLSNPSKVSPETFISFTINSAEMGYGQVEEEYRSEETVAYLFNTEGLKNNILQAHPTTSLSRFRELRIHGKSEKDLPKVDINLGIFIAPKSQQEIWIKFLLKPISEGGAGKSENWINTHVYFYAKDTDLEKVITYIDRYPKLKEKLEALTPPKPGIIVHMKKKPESIIQPKYQKFQWQT